MGRKKDFSTSALASLTGTAPTPSKVIVEKPEAQVVPPVETKAEVEAKENREIQSKEITKGNTTTSTKMPAKTKKKVPADIQNPNKRSVKSSHTPVTLYLNEQNLNKLKEVADEEAQKISWIIDELIYEYLIDRQS